MDAIPRSALAGIRAQLVSQITAQLQARTGTPSVGSKVTDFESLITAACARHSVDPALVKGLIEAESGFNPEAISSAGAKGLMQLMDATAAGLGVTDPFDPAQNIEGGVSLLAGLLQRYGDESLALAAYNAGPGAVDRYGGIPPYQETQVYVPRVLSYRRQFSAGDVWEA